MKLKPIFYQQTNVLDPVESFDEELTKLTEGVLEFAKAFKDPPLVGIASNQLACDGERISKRFCCINVNGEWVVAVNPKISNKSGKVTEKFEGCLTWPMKTICVDRHESVEVEYCDVEGNITTHKASGFEAIVWQHEINHLDGEWEVVLNPKNGKLFGPSVGNIPLKRGKKIGRNDPCLCGSGLKYKKCKCVKS